MTNPNLPFNGQIIDEYEKNLLGSYMLGADIGAGLTASVFSSKKHQVIFQAVSGLKAKNLHLDTMILYNELQKQGKVAEAGGAAYIANLASGTSAHNMPFYEAEVTEACRGRELRKGLLTALAELEKGESAAAVIQSMEEAKKLIANPAQGRESGILFKDLLAKQFPPDNWLIDSLITSGLAVLTGASKIGKSWAVLQLTAALDHGGWFLGKLKAKKCDVVYFALEDTPKRIQNRLKKQGIEYSFGGSRLETKRMTVSALRAFLTENPQYKVCIIDTFQKMMGIDDLNDYAKTVNGMSALKAIADDLDIAIIVVHHNRKSSEHDSDHMESALGSTGLNATADATLTMRRKRGSPEAALYASGRDIEDAAYTLVWDRDICSWSITGQGALTPSLTEAQQQIVDLLESEDRVWTTGEIAEKLGKSKQTISEQATKLEGNGRIEKMAHGQWRAKGIFGYSVSLRETEYPNIENSPETAQEEPW